MGLIFFLSMGDGSKKADTLRSGQAKRPTTIHSDTGLPYVEGVTKTGDKFSASFDDGDYKEADNEIDMEETVQAANDDFSQAVKERLEANERMLDKALEATNEWMRGRLNMLLGDDDNFDQEEIDRIANDIEAKFSDRVNLDLRNKAQELKNDKTIEMEDDVDLDQEGGGSVPEDLEKEEKDLVQELKDEIDDAAADIRTNIRTTATEVMKDVLKAALKQKFGRSYEILMDGDEISGYRKKSSSSTSSTHKKSSSGGSHHSSSSSTAKASKKASQHSSSARHSSSGHSSSHHKSSSSHHKSSSSHHTSTRSAPKYESPDASVSADAGSDDKSGSEDW